MNIKDLVIVNYLLAQSFSEFAECDELTQCATGFDTSVESVEAMRNALNEANRLIRCYADSKEQVEKYLQMIDELVTEAMETE